MFPALKYLSNMPLPMLSLASAHLLKPGLPLKPALVDPPPLVSYLPQIHPSHHCHLSLSQILFLSYQVGRDFARTKRLMGNMTVVSKELKVRPLARRAMLVQRAESRTVGGHSRELAKK
jgi:hypothetical protein